MAGLARQGKVLFGKVRYDGVWSCEAGVECSGKVCKGWSGRGAAGKAGLNMALFGKVGFGRRGLSGHGGARLGMVWQVWQGRPGTGEARLGTELENGG